MDFDAQYPTVYCAHCETELKPYGQRSCGGTLVRVYYSCPRCGADHEEILARVEEEEGDSD